MDCHPQSKFVCLLINSAIVLAVFLGIDFLIYMKVFPGSNPYDFQLGSKLIFTVIMAVAYAQVYNMASYNWRPDSTRGFFFYAHNGKNDCGASIPKILNGVIFSALVSVVILFCIALSAYFISYVYIFLLQGFHGEPPPRDVYDVGGKLITAGILLEIGGKTGSDGHM
jgi:hypothetical protein